MKKAFLVITLIAFLIIFNVLDVQAQCPMCRMAVESNQQNGGTSAQGLNNGILYLLTMPYILIGSLAFIWYRNRNKPLKET